jgi:hypothetical protein
MTEKLRVGSRVGVRFGSSVRPAVIVEDRGHLGPDGDQVWRMRIETPPGYEDDAFEVEVPQSWLEPAPEPPTIRRSRTRRRSAAA